MPDEMLFSELSGINVLTHLDKAYQDSSEMILNNRVSAFLDYQRLPSMSISTYVAGFYARLDNLAQLQIPMVVASAHGSYKVKDMVDSMRKLYGATANASFATVDTKTFCNYCKKKNHIEADCWKKRKAAMSEDPRGPQIISRQSKTETYVTFVSVEQESAERSALIDSGAVHTIIGQSTLEKIMKSYGISRIDKCQPVSLVHRFGMNGVPIEAEFGAILPWSAQDVKGVEHNFNLRADVLEGDHPFLIGCPTLMALKASLDFEALNLEATINGTRCAIPLYRSGNHLFLGHASRPSIPTTDRTLYQHQPPLGHYEILVVSLVQYFPRPGPAPYKCRPGKLLG
jgi:hypothetical protein